MRKGSDPQHTSSLDAYLELLKKLSVLSTLLTAVGLMLLYFLGIAIFSSLTSTFGVPPFEFTLQKCIEYGSGFTTEILAAIPLLALFGLKNYFAESGAAIHFLVGLPLFLIFAIRFIMNRRRATARRFLPWVLMFSLIYMLLFLSVVYLTTVASMGSTNLLLDPAVNVALQHKAELENGVSPQKFGIHHWTGFTVDTVIKDANWKYEQIGIMYLLLFVSAFYAFSIIRLCGKVISNYDLVTPFSRKYLYKARRLLVLLSLLFVAGFIYVLAGRTSVLLYSITTQKVDPDIPGREEITSKYYGILAAEYETDWLFYYPNLQQLIRVPKSGVRSILTKGNISVFADRFAFIKRPWLGVIGGWATGVPDPESKVAKIEGFKINEVQPGSPAHRAGMMPEDVITSIAGVTVDGEKMIADMMAAHPLGKQITLEVTRKGESLKLTVTVEQQP